MFGKPELSIIVPIFNEEGNLQELYSRLAAVLKRQNLSYEIIMVDDGSTDRSLAKIHELSRQDGAVKAISFSRNFGHMIALSAGLDHATGEVVITLDADLQHPPELIPELVKRWKSGAEIVSTVRTETKRGGRFKDLTARCFYWLINKIARLDLPANAADYRLLDKKVVVTLKNIRERSRFLRGLIGWVGYKQEFIPYQADPRFSGRTKYSLGKMVSFAIDGITSFSAVPLRLSAYLGLAIAFFSFLYILYAIYVRIFTSQAIAGWTSVLVVVLFIGGVQLIFLGIIGEYLSRVFEETKERPLYIIREKSGF
ncbi:MAG: glycosyltransferase family 2 protein [Candidatus Margulisbacteria bacterium]|nr:glycosyltransferase family 2 protein [Candidatus Margulisiibacteriota bacterium]